MGMKKETRYGILKMREHKLSQRDSAHEQPGALRKVRRNLRNLEKELNK